MRASPATVAFSSDLTAAVLCATKKQHWLNTGHVLGRCGGTSVNPPPCKTYPVARNRVHVDEHAVGQNHGSPCVVAMGVITRTIEACNPLVSCPTLTTAAMRTTPCRSSVAPRPTAACYCISPSGSQMTSRTRVVRTTGALTLKDAESPSPLYVGEGGRPSPPAPLPAPGEERTAAPPRPLRETGVGGEGAPSLRQDAEA